MATGPGDASKLPGKLEGDFVKYQWVLSSNVACTDNCSRVIIGTSKTWHEDYAVAYGDNSGFNRASLYHGSFLEASPDLKLDMHSTVASIV